MPKSPSQSLPRASARELLAVNLVVMRRQRGWSQEELAAEAGLHRTFVAHVERRGRNISLDNLEKLADALGTRVHRLLMQRAPPD
jgi:transcriptional regulator with XRE-family HTH domain